jgi:hypothetical protein
MTNLFLTNASMASVTPSGAETTRWKAAGSAGGPASGAKACNKNTVAGPTAPLPVTDSQTAGTNGNTLAWYSDPVAAVTIAGQITASLWGAESATTANSAPCIGVYRCDALGAVISAIVDPATAGSQGAAEFSTTAGSKTCTVAAATVVDTALAAGDRLKITLLIDDAADQGGSGSMTASSRSAQLYVNGPTGQNGQSQIAFTETIISVNFPIIHPATAGRPVNPGREAPAIISGN